MEWKDTVMGEDLIKDAIGKEYDRRYPLVRASMADLDCYNAVAQTQAEISFKAGQEDVCTVSVSEIMQKGIEQGRKEVVEWIDARGEPTHEDHPFNTNPSKDTRWYFSLYILSDVWQAKLKEWGIKS